MNKTTPMTDFQHFPLEKNNIAPLVLWLAGHGERLDLGWLSWQTLLSACQQGIIKHKKETVACYCLAKHSSQLIHISFGFVAPKWRQRGVARYLLLQLKQQYPDAHFITYAPSHAKTPLSHLGFNKQDSLLEVSGRTSGKLFNHPCIQPLDQSNPKQYPRRLAESLDHLNQQQRSQLWPAILQQPNRQTLIYRKNQHVEGIISACCMDAQAIVGPLFASTPAVADYLFQALVGQYPQVAMSFCYPQSHQEADNLAHRYRLSGDQKWLVMQTASPLALAETQMAVTHPYLF